MLQGAAQGVVLFYLPWLSNNVTVVSQKTAVTFSAYNTMEKMRAFLRLLRGRVYETSTTSGPPCRLSLG